jgi:hypothetical protein
MGAPDTTTEAHAATRPRSVSDLPDYAPVPSGALGPALNEGGYYVGRVERNLYWVTDGTLGRRAGISPSPAARR